MLASAQLQFYLLLRTTCADKASSREVAYLHEMHFQQQPHVLILQSGVHTDQSRKALLVAKQYANESFVPHRHAGYTAFPEVC